MANKSEWGSNRDWARGSEKPEYVEQMFRVEQGGPAGVASWVMFPYLMGNIVDSRISINAPFLLRSFLRTTTEA